MTVQKQYWQHQEQLVPIAVVGEVLEILDGVQRDADRHGAIR